MRNSTIHLVLLLALTINFLFIRAQPLATLQVKVQNDKQLLIIPVHVNLDAITLLPDSLLQLVEVKEKRRIPVTYQIEKIGHRNLYWIIQPNVNEGKTRIFELIKGKPLQNTEAIKAVTANGFLTISNNNKNLLQYNYKTVYPPQGVDPVYKRSGFIHPLWSPRGQDLTRINAPDHYHHWGLWNPWTQTIFEKDTVDFWNLAKKQGTVRFAHFLSTISGNIFAEFKTLHEHVVFAKTGGDKIALNEVQSVRIYHSPHNSNYYIADITVQLNCASESPLQLLEYRYGGLGIRATEEWNRDNSRIITSEGKNRRDADGTRAKWCMIQGAVKGDHAGLVVMSHPTNYNHPEPLRVWPEDMNNRGDVFLNFSPTKNMNWMLDPGKNYVLQYRFLVFNDSLSKEKAEAAWQHFAHPPAIFIKLHTK